MFNATGPATPADAASFCVDTTIRTNLDPLYGKVFAVDLTVTGIAEREAVIEIEPEFRKVCEGFDVVGMKIGPRSICSAVLACIIIAFINLFSPFRELSVAVAPFGIRSFPALPKRRFFPSKYTSPVCSRAFNGAQFLLSLVRDKFFSAYQALCVGRRPTHFAALIRAIFGGVFPTGYDFKLLAANDTCFFDPLASDSTAWRKAAWYRAILLILVVRMESRPARFAPFCRF